MQRELLSGDNFSGEISTHYPIKARLISGEKRALKSEFWESVQRQTLDLAGAAIRGSPPHDDTAGPPSFVGGRATRIQSLEITLASLVTYMAP